MLDNSYQNQLLAAAAAAAATTDANEAAASAITADTSEDVAVNAANAAASSALAANTAKTSIENRYYGNASTDPLLRPDGSARQAGDRYYNTASSVEKVFNGTIWTIPNVGAADLANGTDAAKGAALVGFLQSGTGSAGRTVKDKFSDVISVKDFGATGDGIVDDTAAFQKAADVGGSIFVPSGTYIVDYVNLTKNVEFTGTGITSTIKKKNNSTHTSPLNTHSWIFNVNSFDLTLGFYRLNLDGNYTGQSTTYTGASLSNNQVINQWSGTPTANLGFGGIISNLASPGTATATSRLVVRFRDCKIQRCITTGLYFQGQLNTGNFCQLDVEGCDFSDFGPTIVEYHDGTSLYDNIVYPSSGYSNYTSGTTCAHIYLTDGFALRAEGNIFSETRNPSSGTITAGYDWNMYNLPTSAIICTISTPNGIEDPTLEWTQLNITGNKFIGLGRTVYTGNGIGPIDMYARAGAVVISDNIFTNSYGAPIRGKTNAKHVSITGNVIETVFNELGINIGPASREGQTGYYTITGNVVRNAGAGIQITGNNVPLENSNPNVPDDVNSAVDAVVISNNIIEGITGLSSANPVFSPGVTGYGWGIQVRYANGVSINGNIVRNLTGTQADGRQHGIYARDTTGQLSIVNNVVQDVIKSGINVFHTGDMTVSNNNVRNTSSYGIYLTGTGSLIASNNSVISAINSGIVAGSSSITNAIISENYVSDISDNTSSNCYGIDGGSRTAGLIIFKANHIQNVSNAGSGAAYGARLQFATVSDSNIVIVEGNSIQNIEESGIFFNCVNGTVIGNIFRTTNTSAVTTQGSVCLLNGVSNIGTLRFISNVVDTGAAPFATTGGGSGDTMRNNGKLHEDGNSWQSKDIFRSAIPTAGTWAIGDKVWNSAPTASGILGWICTTAGTPGTWKVFGSIAA